MKNMPLVPRAQLSGSTEYFHIICRGNNHSRLFQDEEDFETFRQRLYRYKIKWPFNIYHYVFMTTHAHLQIHLLNFPNISRAMQGLLLSYCHYFQRKYPSIGHLWHNRFRSIPIVSENHLMRCGRYIELNSVSAGMVPHPEQYPWSSYHFYGRGKGDNLISTNPLYENMGSNPLDRQIAYQEYIQAGCNLDRQEDRAIFDPQHRRQRRFNTRQPRWSTFGI